MCAQDNDNDLDILVETETGWALLLNSASGEMLESEELLDASTGGGAYPIEAAAFGDVNNDGYPDLFVGSRLVSRPNLLYLNNPKTQMFEANTDSGLTAKLGCTRYGDMDPYPGGVFVSGAEYMARAIRFADFARQHVERPGSLP